jgi:hypothetical protein
MKKMKLIKAGITIAITLMLTSCSKAPEEIFVGDWKVDSELMLHAAIEKSGQKISEKEMDLGRAAMKAQFSEFKFSISETHITMPNTIFPVAKGCTYNVIDSTDDSVTIRTSEGANMTFEIIDDDSMKIAIPNNPVDLYLYRS